MKRVVVFGIFDGVHEGHRSLFTQAIRQAKGKQKEKVELVAVVGRDGAAKKLKGRTPKQGEGERRRLVEQEELVDLAVLGDEEISSYLVLEELQADIVCLGYDQEELAADLEKWIREKGKKIFLKRLKSYLPEKYHSSLL
ncbi:MAG: adenylyltransferase/cytidyltransferase family protein [Patescibacteria group bacterium]